MNSWTIWPRNRNLYRTGDPIYGWSKLEITERYNSPGIVELTGPATALDALLSPDMGVIIDDGDGRQVFSGQIATIDRTSSADNLGVITEQVTLLIEEDDAVLWSRIVWPEPKKVLTDGVVTTFNGTHDKRSGKCETAIKNMVLDQIGALAQPARLDPRLYVPPTTNAGPQVTFESRFGILGEVIGRVAEQAGYRIRVVHDETATTPRLKFEFTPTRNLTNSVLFGTTLAGVITGHVTEWRYVISAPAATFAVVAAQGEMTDRQIIGIGPDTDAEQLWGNRREMLVDQRQADAGSTSGQAEAIANGRARLAEAATPVTVTFSVIDGPDVTYRADYEVGDIVGIELPGLPITAEVIREVTTTIEVTDQGSTEQRRIVIGSPGATETSTSQAVRLAAALRQIRNLERK